VVVLLRKLVITRDVVTRSIQILNMQHYEKHKKRLESDLKMLNSSGNPETVSVLIFGRFLRKQLILFLQKSMKLKSLLFFLTGMLIIKRHLIYGETFFRNHVPLQKVLRCWAWLILQAVTKNMRELPVGVSHQFPNGIRKDQAISLIMMKHICLLSGMVPRPVTGYGMNSLIKKESWLLNSLDKEVKLHMILCTVKVHME